MCCCTTSSSSPPAGISTSSLSVVFSSLVVYLCLPCWSTDRLLFFPHVRRKNLYTLCCGLFILHVPRRALALYPITATSTAVSTCTHSSSAPSRVPPHATLQREALAAAKLEGDRAAARDLRGQFVQELWDLARDFRLREQEQAKVDDLSKKLSRLEGVEVELQRAQRCAFCDNIQHCCTNCAIKNDGAFCGMCPPLCEAHVRYDWTGGGGCLLLRRS